MPNIVFSRWSLIACSGGVVALAACGGTTEPPAPAGITVTPSTLSFSARGAQKQLTAAVTDQHGNALQNATVTWSSNNTAVVTVSSSGLAASVGNGTTQIVATAGSVNTPVTVTVAQAAFTLQKTGGDNQSDTVGRQLPQALVVQLTDSLGNPIPNATVSFSVTSGNGNVTPPSALTDASGNASTRWTIGTISGVPQRVTANSSPATAAVFGATATAGPPNTVVKEAGDSQAVAIGTAVVIKPSVLVNDQYSNHVPNATVTFTPGSNSGSVTSGTVLTSASGIATVGGWTVNSGPGMDTLYVTVPGITGNAARFLAKASTPGPPASVVVRAGDAQTGLVGYALNFAPAVLVRDTGGLASAGVQVTFAVASGGGSVTSGAVATTNASGIAQVGKWVLGASPGVNALTATVTGGSIIGNPVTFADTGLAAGYPITIQPYGAGLSPAAQTAFDSAVAKWQRLIYRPLSAVSLSSVTAGTCGPGTPALSGTTNGLVIYASVDSIDGPGRILAEGGPCLVRSSSGLTVVGVMKFDSADIGGLISNGTLSSVVLHEMTHVIGFGILWGPPTPPITANCLQLPSTPPGTIQDTYFSCPKGQAAFESIGGTSYTGGNIVPVENCGTSPYVYPTCSSGTVNGHWRQVVFGNELMVGFLSNNPVLSVVTVAAQEDLGYTVNYAAADPYTHTFSLLAGPAAATAVHLENDILNLPIYVVDAGGRVMGVLRR
jgi:hypothetical protein